MSRRGKVFICGEFTGDGITSTTAELIQHGRVISDLFEEPLHLFLIGEGAQEAAEEAVQRGVDKVHLSQGLPFSESHPESYLARVLQVSGQIEPTLILIGQTEMGREIAPRLAARIEASDASTAVTTHSTSLGPPT